MPWQRFRPDRPFWLVLAALLVGAARYYAGRSLSEIPDIVAVELEQAARPIVNEGEFSPTVAGRAPATESLDASPPLAGYLATTAKPTAQTLLRIGAEHDPLLASGRWGSVPRSPGPPTWRRAGPRAGWAGAASAPSGRTS
ncbi:MAG: hypothetical protein ACRDZ4_19670 [Egibacteraceae bacterium]